MPLAAYVLPSGAATPAQKQQDLATIHGYTNKRSRRRYATNPHLVAAQPAVGPNWDLAGRGGPARRRYRNGLPNVAGCRLGRRPPPNGVSGRWGIYRLWRDGGFAVGALLSGIIADAYDIPVAVTAVAAPTGASGIVVALRRRSTDQKRR